MVVSLLASPISKIQLQRSTPHSNAPAFALPRFGTMSSSGYRSRVFRIVHATVWWIEATLFERRMHDDCTAYRAVLVNSGVIPITHVETGVSRVFRKHDTNIVTATALTNVFAVVFSLFASCIFIARWRRERQSDSRAVPSVLVYLADAPSLSSAESSRTNVRSKTPFHNQQPLRPWSCCWFFISSKRFVVYLQHECFARDEQKLLASSRLQHHTRQSGEPASKCLFDVLKSFPVPSPISPPLHSPVSSPHPTRLFPGITPSSKTRSPTVYWCNNNHALV
jgi:hypothetical protein